MGPEDIQASVVISAAMLVISLVLGTAMSIGWACFGRPRHALSWAIAYYLYGIEIAAVAVSTIRPDLYPALEMVEFACILAAAALVAIGARQRAKLNSWARGIGITFAVIFLANEALRHSVHPWWLSATDGLFTSVMLSIAISAIRPRDREPEAAEWATMATLAVFVLFELTLVFLDMKSRFHPEDQQLASFFTDFYLAGLTPVFVANGVAANLLIASDLAVKLRALAASDPLTGVFNRRGFHDAAVRAVANGRRHRQPIAVVLVDIDHFKSINDRFGHTAGDRTLHFISRSLSRALRKGDLVGRIGGEEFALLLVNSSAEEAVEVMDRIRSGIANGFHDEAMPVPVTASFGVTAVDLGSGSAEEMLAEALDQADRALYRSKIEGRNRTTLAVLTEA
jgi:diguanylate cyclase (GGDEF)-like protein